MGAGRSELEKNRPVGNLISRNPHCFFVLIATQSRFRICIRRRMSFILFSRRLILSLTLIVTSGFFFFQSGEFEDDEINPKFSRSNDSPIFIFLNYKSQKILILALIIDQFLSCPPFIFKRRICTW